MENIENQMIVGSYYEGEVEIEPLFAFDVCFEIMSEGNEVDTFLNLDDDFQYLYNALAEYNIELSEEQKRKIGKKLIDKHYQELVDYIGDNL